MSKKEKTILPKLRFKQFENSPEWNINELGNLSVPVVARAGTKQYMLMSVTSGVGLISQIEKFGREIAGSAYKNYYVIKKNDFAYNKSATKLYPEGYISMLTEFEEAAVPNSIFTCFRIIDKDCDPRFFDQLFHNNYHGTWLRNYIEVGSRAHGSLGINPRHLWDMPIALPEYTEQLKIADCLTSLDELIAAENKKLEALKIHKKGLMQKLFPAEGKTVPEWRFPEFRDSGEWEIKRISEVTKYVDYRGKTPVKSAGGIFLVTAKNIKMGYVDYFSSQEFIPNDSYSEVMSRGLPKIGDVIITTEAPVGNVAQVDNENVALAQRIIKYRGIENVLNNTYLKFVFLSSKFQAELLSKSTGGIVKGIKGSVLHGLVIDVPKLKEQQKIADCLSEVEALISTQSEKVELLKAHKKGLMQGLFPSVQEVIE